MPLTVPLKSCSFGRGGHALLRIRRRNPAAPLKRLPGKLEHGAAGRFFVTSHAVHKFQRDVMPNASYNRALGALVRLTSAGRFVSGYNGHTMAAQFPGVRLELWRGPVMGTRANQRGDSRMRFVVAYGPGELPQVVTVLPKGTDQAVAVALHELTRC